jgi:hypothetical protein
VNRLSRDFTLDKYLELCQVILEKSDICTVLEYISEKPTGNITILRHDVDRKILNALRMAQWEHDRGIHSSYYFRYPATFIPDIIRKIKDLDHEVGYHYEVLSKANGDNEKAIELFQFELEEFRTICDIQTICMHGSPLSRYDNRDLWKKYNFHDFGIKGEAYISMANSGSHYFSDTGRNWGGKDSLRDWMPCVECALPHVQNTNNLIAWIGSSDNNSIYLTVHPERWAEKYTEWITQLILDLIINSGKKVISARR